MSPIDDPRKVLTEEQIKFLENIGAKFIEIAEFSDTTQNSSNVIVDVDGKYKQVF